MCVVELAAIEPMQRKHERDACIKLYDRAKVWHLKNLRLVDPIFKVKGKLSLFDVKLPKNTRLLPVGKGYNCQNIKL